MHISDATEFICVVAEAADMYIIYSTVARNTQL